MSRSGPRGIHASWLDGIAAPADPVSLWRARWAWAAFPAMPETRPGPPRDAAHLVALAHDDLARFLAETGRDQLAFATGLRDGILAAARVGHLVDRRAAIGRCRGATLDELDLVRVGARAIAGHIDALQRKQLVVRLPRPLGIVVERELGGDWGVDPGVLAG